MLFNRLKQILANVLIHSNRSLLNTLITTFLRHGPRPVKTKFGYSIYLTADTSLSGMRLSVIRGRYEAHYMHLLASLVKPGDTVIDIGANEGYVSLLLAMKVGAHGNIYSIEPNPSNIKALEANIRLNALTNISVIPRAVSDKGGGRIQMYGNGAWGSLQRQGNLSIPAILVEVDFLDAMFADNKAPVQLRQLSLIKIDAEGSEIRIIRGAHKLITMFRPIVGFEVNLTMMAYEDISINEVFDFFSGIDYTLFVERKGKLVPLVWLDERILNCLAMPRERCGKF